MYLTSKYLKKQITSQLEQEAATIEAIFSRTDETRLERLMALASSISSSRVLAVDNEGTVIADSKEGQSSLLGRKIPVNLISRTLKYGRREVFDFPTLGKDAVGVSVPWVNTSGRNLGAIILVKPLHTTSRQATRDALAFTARAGLVACIAGAIVAWIIASNITGPLSEISKAACAIAEGRFDQEIQIRADDELGEVASAINTMSRRISDLVGKLVREQENLKNLMEQRSTLMSDISHDLRTPVTSIRGFVEALEDGLIKDPEEQAKVLRIIRSETERLSRLVDDLFFYARLETGDIPVDLSHLDLASVAVSAAEKMLPIALQKNVRLEQKVLQPHIPINGSEEKLTRVILNLLDNAIKFSPNGGTVRITAGIEGSQAFLRVEDEGPGIDPEDLPHIFDRFYRGKKAKTKGRSGAGLGLAIAKVIIEKHNGSIEARNCESGGAVLEFRLPAVI